MATLPQALEEDDIKRISLGQLKKEYLKISTNYNKILDNKLLYCGKCNEHYAPEGFYSDDNYASGKFPICKKCIMAMVEQRKRKNDEPNETKQSVQNVLMLMDLPYNDDFYNSCLKGSEEALNEKNRKSPFATYITCLKSLPQWRGLRWADSQFGDNSSFEESYASNEEKINSARKIFGNGFSNEDYTYLKDQYDDWCSRVQVDSKSQEIYVVQICFILLDIYKTRKKGGDCDKLVKQLNEVTQAANLQPRQNVANSSADTLTFGQLIEKWELEKPIPEPSEEFKDCDKIGKYIRVWFKGHLAKALGLDNAYTKEYEDCLNEYTVKKIEYSEEENSEDIYNSLFGNEAE